MRRTGRAGLTLVEVILAITILGMGLTALIATASRCVGAVRKAKNLETARHLLARVEFENPVQLMVEEDEIREGTESGSFSGGPSGYNWEREITMVGEEEDELFSVRTRVSWSDRGRAAHEEVITYIHVPAEQHSTGP